MANEASALAIVDHEQGRDAGSKSKQLTFPSLLFPSSLRHWMVSRRFRPKKPNRSTLPWEVLLIIIKSADPAALAVLSRVSLEFLEECAPLLYYEVKITTVKKLRSLFGERKQPLADLLRPLHHMSNPSRINKHLCLNQIQILILDFGDRPSANDRRRLQRLLNLSFSRAIGPGPIKMKSFRIHLPYGNLHFEQLLRPSLMCYLHPERNWFLNEFEALHYSKKLFEDRHWIEIKVIG